MRAAEWVARLDGAPLTEDEKRALKDWLDADTDHRAAFEEAASTWRQLSQLHLDPGPLRGLAAKQRRAAQNRRVAGMGALVGLMLLGGAFARYHYGDLWLLATADYRTSPGETRMVTLADGSSVELGPASAIAVAFNNDERRVKFLAGEAFFSAMPRTGNEPRPFVVEAAGGTTTALGTQFVVEAEGNGADVLAVEHQVNVAFTWGEQKQDVVLSPGQEVRYTPERGMGHIRTRDVDAATAWRRGMLVFNGTPLSHVVEELNRYRRGRIVILDEALGRRRVSGVFATNDLSDAIETITAELGIEARSIYPLITVLY